MLRYSFGNIDGKAYGLNANELSVYEAIGKCSRKDDARGWYADMQTLAEQLPHRIGRMTVSRAVDKLLTLGLIRRDGNSLFVCAQNERGHAQNEHADAQNEHADAQNEQNPAPPLYPPINNKNKMEKEQQRALCARDCEEQQDCQFLEEDFNAFWIGFNPKPEFANRKNATWEIWKTKTPVARKKILEAVLSGTFPIGEGGGRGSNPYFFVVDFPEPTPDFLRGDEDGRIVQVRYNGLFKLCSPDTMELFNLEYVRDWK